MGVNGAPGGERRQCDPPLPLQPQLTADACVHIAEALIGFDLGLHYVQQWQPTGLTGVHM